MLQPSGASVGTRGRNTKYGMPSSSTPNEDILVAIQAPSGLPTGSPAVPDKVLKLHHENVSQPPTENAKESSDEGLSKRRKKMKYHRHTLAQIHILETAFAECAHPDEKRRRVLGAQLGISGHQVKFWFQNKRNQVKNHYERQQNHSLKGENERLQGENIRMKQIIQSAQCPNCGGTSAAGEASIGGCQLMIENQHLKQQIEQMSALVGSYSTQLVMPTPNVVKEHTARAYAAAAAKQAHSAMVELIELVKYADPLWIHSPDGLMEILNEAEYIKAFSGNPRIRPRIPGLCNYEDSRATGIIMLNCRNIIEIMMNPSHFRTFFPSLVSRASKGEVYSKPDPDSYCGAIQMMTIECQAPSPLVPRREFTVLRYCQQKNEGLWAVVDISVNAERHQDASIRRRPSGCILQEMSHNITKVIWIEHVEVDDYSNTDIMYEQVVKSGIVFGARRWVSSLERQAQLLANVNSNPRCDAVVAAQLDGRRNTYKLAEKMIMTFFNSINGTPNDGWSTFAGIGKEDNILITSRVNASDPGKPCGIVLCASVSFWLPIPIRMAFEILFAEAARNEFEALSPQGGNAAPQSAQVARGINPADNISILRAIGAAFPDTILLGQSVFDPMGAYIIYSPIESIKMQMVLDGENSAYIPVLPSGFAVIPDSLGDGSQQCQLGSLVTIGYQILLDTTNLDVLSIDPAEIAKLIELIVNSCGRIKASVTVPVNLVYSAGHASMVQDNASSLSRE